jgi:hypothetical protein
VVIVKHVVRNALIPVVTLVALQMPAIFGGDRYRADLPSRHGAVDQPIPPTTPRHHGVTSCSPASSSSST